MQLANYIRNIPDFPIPGILFRDITPLLGDPIAFQHVIDRFTERYHGEVIDSVVAIEARGFLFGAPLAYRLGTSLVPVRKPGKLPYSSIREEYALEYGTDAVEIHSDSIAPGQRVVVVDDLLATGGTLSATARLVEKAGGTVAGIALLIELLGLEGRKQLADYNILSLIQYEGA